MKKFFVVVFCIFSVNNLWAVWEGNAGVGRVSDFNIGTMSVRSDLFPKNTFISIENLENGKKTTALVIGTSGIAGLLVHVSPEVAEVLEIASDRIVRVRIETTTKLAEDFLNEDALYSLDSDYNPNYALSQLTTATDENEYSDTDTVLFDPASLKNYPKPKTPVEEVPGPAPVTETSEPATVDVEPETPPVETPVAETQDTETTAPQVNPPIPTNEQLYLQATGLRPPTSQATNPAPSTQSQTVPATQPTSPAPSQTATTAAKPVGEVSGVSAPKQETATTATKPVGEVSGVSAPKQETATTATKPVGEVSGVNAPKQETATTATKPVGEVSGVNAPKQETTTTATKPVGEVSGVSAPKQETTTTATKPVGEVSGVSAPKQETATTAAKPVGEVSGITVPEPEKLEPIKSEPEPVNDKQKETLVASSSSSSGLTVLNEPSKPVVEVEPKSEPKLEPKVEPVPEPKTEPKPEPVYEVEPYTLTNDAKMYSGTLERGKNYLQIANYANENNVKSVLSRYKQYPLVVVKTGSGATTRYRVFVGPLTRDEMGGTLEQFQLFGFKDAFFKVIQ